MRSIANWKVGDEYAPSTYPFNLTVDVAQLRVNLSSVNYARRHAKSRGTSKQPVLCDTERAEGSTVCMRVKLFHGVVCQS